MKPNVSRPRAGRSPAASSRSSTIAPLISLPCEIASRATCGPGAVAAKLVNPSIPVFPVRQGARSGTVSRTSNRGSGRSGIATIVYPVSRSIRRRRKRSQATICSSVTNSSGLCACAMSPGPQMIVGMPAFW